jgi:molybdenum cofactor biosynthesis enzyme MoaA
MNFVIPILNQYAYNTIPRNSELKYKITNRCNVPSKTLLIDYSGNCFVCGCEAWLPVTIGSITDFNDFSEIINSPVARALQEDIDQQLFSHCAVDRCGILTANRLFDQFTVSINIDESCNLACPSCRREPVMITNGTEFEIKKTRVHHIIKLLETADRPVHVVMSGNGDPLASAIMRPLIHSWKPKSDQTMRLFTNGLLLKKQLADSPVISHITQYFISMDAGSADVYENVRRPGKWTNLIENLDFLREVVDRTGAEVLLKFVCQDANWRDLENFLLLCKHYRFKGNVSRLEDWGTFGKDFAKHNILDPEHPDHNAALKEIKRVIDNYNVWDHFWFDRIFYTLTGTII